MIDKWQVARTLDEIAHYLELSEPNRFKAIAFERAARKVESLEADITKLVSSGELTETPGIGKATGAVIEELVRTGGSRYLDELRAQFPAGIFELLRVPGLGLKKIGILFAKLGIGSLDELEAAARSGKLAALPGFGAKTQQKILGGIAFARQREERFLLPVGLEVAEMMRERLATIDLVIDAEVTGSVRRRLEVVRNVNLAVATRAAKKVVDAIRKRGFVDELESIDDATWKGRARNEIDVFFHLSPPEEFGATVLRTTGSAEFVEAFVAKAGKLEGVNEEEVFAKAGIAFVEPERRETADDLRARKRPALVHVSDLRGTFHVHTTYSDGRNTLEEMLAAAQERGFDYVGISDHSKAAYYAGGLTEERLVQQKGEIERKRKAVAPMRIFRGTEADILPDGSIDYGDEILSQFDFVIASVHSRFTMTKEEMTERILRALDNPYVTFLGHLTGRKLLSRDGYSIEFEPIFEKAARRGVMIEINGNPNRLDIDWRHLRRAHDLGVGFSIHPDAHSIREYNALISGTWVARKGGLSAKQIFNTQPLEAVEEYLEKRRAFGRGVIPVTSRWA